MDTWDCTSPDHDRAFYTVTVWSVAGKEWPLFCRHFLETLFGRTFQGLPLGLKADEPHPFAEPLVRRAEAAHRPRGNFRDHLRGGHDSDREWARKRAQMKPHERK